MKSAKYHSPSTYRIKCRTQNDGNQPRALLPHPDSRPIQRENLRVVDCLGFCLIYIVKAGGTQLQHRKFGRKSLIFVFSLLMKGSLNVGLGRGRQVHRLDPPWLKLCQPDRKASALLPTEGPFIV